jgi:hypothetical protein
MTSRLSVVEAARALLRTRLRLDFPETLLAEIERQIEILTADSRLQDAAAGA